MPSALSVPICEPTSRRGACNIRTSVERNAKHRIIAAASVIAIGVAIGFGRWVQKMQLTNDAVRQVLRLVVILLWSIVLYIPLIRMMAPSAFKELMGRLEAVFKRKMGPVVVATAQTGPAPVVAGVGQMPYRRFLAYNVAGGAGWVGSMTWAGYLLGNVVPNIDRHIHIVVIVVIVLSVIPIAVEILRERRRQSAPSTGRSVS